MQMFFKPYWDHCQTSSAAVANTGGLYFASDIRMLLQKLNGGKEAIHRFCGIDFLLQLTPF
ncbi:hypothetical protein GA0061070_102838 [Kosakonia oryziphila]|uniref:Uncharacterized protein n=1 Tax=Kosakonia oryziphila TaxID=1005667 RepID=A0A1C4EXV8_9ENTR|nr:hypothetical protein GA0061070_102838 [Kosakonia oryziphila]